MRERGEKRIAEILSPEAESVFPVLFFGSAAYPVNAFVLETIKDLPGIEIFSNPTGQIYNFRFDGGAGVFIGINNF